MHCHPFEGRHLVTIRKGRLLLVNDQGFRRFHALSRVEVPPLKNPSITKIVAEVICLKVILYNAFVSELCDEVP